VAALALAAAGVIARPPLLEAAEPPWEPPPCAPSTPRGSPANGVGVAWYRLDGVLDASGTLAGRRLWLGLAGRVTHHMELPPESFATGPTGSVVLVGEDDGTRSRLSLVDVSRGCARSLGEEPDVVRSGLLARDRKTVLEHRVDRVTRLDLGVWRVSQAPGRAAQVLPGAAPDPRYGRTFTTRLGHGPGDLLTVTSCGEHACRTRVVDLRTRRSLEIGPTGPVVGVTPDGDLVAHAGCAGSPCALMRYGTDGESEVLVPEAGRAALGATHLVFEVPGGGVSVLDLEDGSLHPVDDATGLVPLADGSDVSAGAEHAPDQVVLARDGRLDGRTGRVLAPGGWLPVGIGEARQ